MTDDSEIGVALGLYGHQLLAQPTFPKRDSCIERIMNLTTKSFWTVMKVDFIFISPIIIKVMEKFPPSKKTQQSSSLGRPSFMGTSTSLQIYMSYIR